jgi:hypothetical protein
MGDRAKHELNHVCLIHYARLSAIMNKSVRQMYGRSFYINGAA